MRSSKVRSYVLLLLDVAGLFFAFNLAHQLRLGHWIRTDSIFLWVLISVIVLCFYVMDVYRVHNARRPWRFAIDTAIAMIIAGLACVVVIYALGVEKFTSIFGRGVFPVTLAMFSVWAIGWRTLIASTFISTHGAKRWLLIGKNEIYRTFYHESRKAHSDYEVEWLESSVGADKVKQWINEYPSQSGLIIENISHIQPPTWDVIAQIDPDSRPVLTIVEYYEQYWSRLPVTLIKEDWFVQNLGHNLLNDRIGIRLKRLLDFIFAVLALVILSPLFIVIYCLIFVSSPGKVIYKQRRVGLNGRVFTLYKFRSMVEGAEKVGAQWSAVDDPRVTRIGKFLRASRLDELPQLWNLVVGDMSLIGPRPERPEFVESLKQEIPLYQKRELVPPGLTGWAQVMYTYGASVEDARRKLEYDLYYIKNHSIRLDILIMFKTVAVMIKGIGR